MNHISCKILLAVLILFIYSQKSYASIYNYRATLALDLKSISIKICFESALKNQNFKLVSYGESFAQRISEVAVIYEQQKEQRKLNPNFVQNKNSILFYNLNKKNCISYRAKLMNDIMHRLRVNSIKKQVLTDPSEWLLYPDLFSKNDSISIKFILPENINVSSPWTLSTRSKISTNYTISKRPNDWYSLVVFGAFEVEDINIGASVIRYALVNGSKKVERAKIRSWFNRNLDALISVYGELPVASLQVLIVPLGRGGEPVPWGQVKRGGGDAVHLYIDETQSLQQFLDDWVLSHELSHLLHPKMWGQAAWLYEGMASYYQNVIRARVELLTANLAWAKLDAGFERGKKNTVDNKTLHEVTKTMNQTQSYMRVYWSGAAIFLMADTRLRRLSNNRQSLDSTLKLFNTCCFQQLKWWSAVEFMEKMDDLSKSNIFTTLYYEYAFSDKFPRLSRAYQQLGLLKRAGQFKQREKLPNTIRHAIMTGNK